MKARFFDLVDTRRPDIIVLDLSRASASASTAILTVKQRTHLPILVVCKSEHAPCEEYRTAGAADCITAPVNITALHEAIHRILRGSDKAPLARLHAIVPQPAGAIADSGRAG